MGQQYRLRSLANEDLLAALSTIVRRGNEITAELLAHLAELDERQLFLELGFSSLFKYCTAALGLCEATAGRRVAAVRVCRQFPKVFARVASGELHVSALCLLKQYLTAENAAALFDLCTRKGSREIEELLAARFPRPDVRERIHLLPARSQPALNVESQTAPPPAHLSGQPGQARTLPNARGKKAIPDPAPMHSRLDPLSPDRYGVHFTADGEFRELLDRVLRTAVNRTPRRPFRPRRHPSALSLCRPPSLCVHCSSAVQELPRPQPSAFERRASSAPRNAALRRAAPRNAAQRRATPMPIPTAGGRGDWAVQSPRRQEPQSVAPQRTSCCVLQWIVPSPSTKSVE